MIRHAEFLRVVPFAVRILPFLFNYPFTKLLTYQILCDGSIALTEKGTKFSYELA